MKNNHWNKIGVIAAIILSVPVVGSVIATTVAIWHLPERVSHLENRFDSFDAKLNGLAGHIVVIDQSTNQMAAE